MNRLSVNSTCWSSCSMCCAFTPLVSHSVYVSAACFPRMKTPYFPPNLKLPWRAVSSQMFPTGFPIQRGKRAFCCCCCCHSSCRSVIHLLDTKVPTRSGRGWDDIKIFSRSEKMWRNLLTFTCPCPFFSPSSLPSACFFLLKHLCR